jgi:hypothetical protein
MDSKRLLAITLVLVVSGSALTWARQRTGNLPPIAPFDLAPDPSVPSPFADDPSPAPSSPDVPATQPPVDTGTFPESRLFIDQGIATAERAIESLSSERDRLRDRIGKIEAELARWEAVNRGLVSARQAKPGPSSDVEPLLPPPGDLSLEPLAAVEDDDSLPPLPSRAAPPGIVDDFGPYDSPLDSTGN